MIENPYTHVTAAEIEPGQWIHVDDQAMVVDEIRRSSDGLTFLSYPAKRVGTGKRIASLHLANDDVIVLASGAITALALTRAIQEIVDAAAATIDELSFDGSAIRLSADGTLWTVPMARAAALPVGAPQAEPPSDPEPAHDDD